MKKIIGFLMAVLLIFSTIFLPVGAIDFVDVSTEDKALVEAVDLLTYMNIAKGKSETNFGTDEAVTREQFALFVYRLLKGGKDAPKDSANTTTFVDLEDPTYNYAISWANSQGIVKGTSATTFNPKGSITLQDAYTMLVRALGYENKETLSYPFGYIEIAENTKTALNKNIDADYTDILTRGDMAKLIYNAFFAETAIVDIELVERTLSDGSVVLVEKENYSRLCEEYFDVVEVEYQVVATPNFVKNNEEATKDMGNNYIKFNKVDNTKDVPTQFYIDFNELNLRGNSDDYILGHFNLFVTLDKDNEIEKVIYAESLIDTVITSSIALESVKAEGENSYYNNDPKNDLKLSGKVEFEGNVAYFYDAPYSYVKPEVNTEKNRNSNNLKFITLACDNDDVYSYTVEDKEYNAETLIKKLSLVYTNGIYKAKIIDINGDDIYDYILYMPYEAYKVDTDEDYTFANDGINDNIVYTNEAVVSGAEFRNEDYIIGYFNSDANYIDVFKVIKPISAEVKGYSTKNATITLTNGKTYKTDVAWKLLENFRNGENAYEEIDPVLNTSILTNDEFYAYNNIILNTDIKDDYVKYTDNLVIPTNIKTPRVDFETKTGKDTTYIYAWVDGEAKYIPVATKDIYPALLNEEKVADEYAEQLCTYTIRNGLYVITSLAYAEDEDGISESMETDTTLLNTEDEVQIIITNPTDKVTMKKYAGSRFVLSNLDTKVTLNDYTKIIVRIYDTKKDEYEFVEYTANDFVNSVNGAFDTVTYIVANDIERTDRDDLVVLYATVTDDFNFVAKVDKNGYRYIRSSEVKLDDEDEYRNFYEVLNPFTGKIETVIGLDSATKMSGVTKAVPENTFIKLVDGCIDEEKENIDIKEYWITEYDDIDGVISIIESGKWCKDCIDEATETLIAIDRNTSITIMTEEEFNITNLSTIEEPSKKELSYNSKAIKKDKTYTEYAPYLRAYITYSEDKNSDYDVAEFIIIIVEDTENVIASCESHK